MYLGYGGGKEITAFRRRNFLEKVYLEDQEVDRRITLRWILGRQVVWMVSGNNCSVFIKWWYQCC
jgi:hypothetical protein